MSHRITISATGNYKAVMKVDRIKSTFMPAL